MKANNSTTCCKTGISTTKGFIFAAISSCTFGMIPLFSKPVLDAGMDTTSLVFYRFGIGALLILIGLLIGSENLKINFHQLWRLAVLALFSNITAVTLIEGLKHMDSGPATTVQFSYPIFTCLIMLFFFKEKPTFRMIFAMILAFVGVAGISGMKPGDMSGFSAIGVAFELTAGLSYAIYLVLVPKFNLGGMNSLKLTFYVFLFGAILMVPYCMLTPQGLQPIATDCQVHADWWLTFTPQCLHSTVTSMWWQLVLLALIPTALSNYAAVVGLKGIGSTLTAILGALEPLTALAAGCIAFHEEFNTTIAVSAVFIIIAVFLLVIKKKPKPEKV